MARFFSRSFLVRMLENVCEKKKGLDLRKKTKNNRKKVEERKAEKPIEYSTDVGCLL
jgi:hypothetical protein